MYKPSIVPDTVVVVHKDTIVKIVEIVNEKTATDPETFVTFFDQYSNIFTALATVAAFIALFVSIKAINKSSRDGRHQVLVGKLEEICDLLSNFGSDYSILYYAYNLLRTEGAKTEVSRILNRKNFETQWENAISQINLEIYFDKVGRAQVLTNLYLGNKQKKFKVFNTKIEENTLKFNTLGYLEIVNSLLMIIKYKDLKQNSFYAENLPPVARMETLVRNVCEEISRKINFGYNNKGYIKYRNTTFMKLFKND